ncbi:MAG: hypothetical protein ACI9OU_001319 [Candidatus Promineifilaceae bacterium]|jgi:hypothetical protein
MPDMTPTEVKHDTRQKAFRVNLDNSRYGTFAEIGAGQEVVRWFFTVGGAAGTIAKSISAYDMTVSDAIYGKCDRYVCRERLQSMLDYEQNLIVERLNTERGNETAFFAFADTVVAQSYQGTKECHGWMGVKFQAHPRDDNSQIIIHVRMLDRDNAAQQEALGIVGVNLLYGAFFHHYQPEKLLESLLDGLSTERIEIDMIEFSGIEFRHVDNRIMSLKLVQLGLSGVAMLGPDGSVLQPSAALRKKPILVERGSFRPVTKVNMDILASAAEVVGALPQNVGKDVLQVMEITMHNLLSSGSIDLNDFLARADLISAVGKTVLISDYFEYYRLGSYLRQHTNEDIAMCMGAVSLEQLFDEKYYMQLEGGILESLGRLFKNNVHLYIYPYRDPDSNEIIDHLNTRISPDLKHLHKFLVENGSINAIANHDPEILHIFSDDVLRRIKAQDPSWEDMVPPEIADVIKARCFFGYCELSDGTQQKI